MKMVKYVVGFSIDDSLENLWTGFCFDNLVCASEHSKKFVGSKVYKVVSEEVKPS